MLFLQPGTSLLLCACTARSSRTRKCNRVVGKLKVMSPPCTSTRCWTAVRADPRPAGESNGGGEEGGGRPEQDPLYDEAVKIVTESRKASISGVQRRLTDRLQTGRHA